MADLSKLKRKSSLGEPPPLTEASANLDAPEIAPQAVAPSAQARRPVFQAKGENATKDGRSARRTGRTVQFATRVSLQFDERVREIAQREGLLLVEVLERALDAYEKRAFRDN